jgi:hypothetical protein
MNRQLLIILLFFPVFVFGQQQISERAAVRDSIALAHPVDLSISYFGNDIVYPGLKFGAEYLFHSHTKVKAGRKNKLKTHQWVAMGNVGFFWHPRNYTAFFTDFGVLYRHTGTRGFFWNLGLSPAGVMGTFFNETYEVSPDGDVTEPSLPSRWYYSPDFVAGIGHGMKNGKSAWFLNLRFDGMIRHNTFYNALISLEFGFKLNMKRK